MAAGHRVNVAARNHTVPNQVNRLAQKWDTATDISEAMIYGIDFRSEL